MPRLLNGHTVSGVGSSGVNVDDVLIRADAGTPAWILPLVGAGSGDASPEVVCNAVIAGTSRVANVEKAGTTDFWSTSSRWAGEPGANVVVGAWFKNYAGTGRPLWDGSVVAAGVLGSSTYTRLENGTRVDQGGPSDNSGRITLTGLAPFDVDRSTGNAILYEYQEGKNLHIYPPTKHVPSVVIPTGPVYEARSIAGNVVWTEGRIEGRRPFCYNTTIKQNISIQARAGNIYQALMVLPQGAQGFDAGFLVYSTQDGAVYCHNVLNTTKGHKLPAGNHYGLDAEVQPDGKLLVVWSTSAGEVAGTQQSVLWSLANADLEILDIVDPPPPTTGPGTPPGAGPDTGAGGGGGSPDTGSDIGSTSLGTLPGVILSSSSTFNVVGAFEEVVTLPVEVWPAYPVGGGHGRIVHPLLGAFDYEVKPDEWVNIDANPVIQPVWSSTRTLTSAANVLWSGHIRDVVVEERWLALGGLAMPITQLRMLLAIWTMPVDPDIGYVHWYPNYITHLGYKVIPVMLQSGGSGGGITFDDVVNYLDEDDNPIGWMTAPVTFTLKLVDRL